MTPEFRVYDPEKNAYLNCGDTLQSLLSNPPWDIFKPDTFVFEQYTGLKAQGGAKVFEGDIVHAYDQEPDRDDGYIGSSVEDVVKFENGAFWLGKIEYRILLDIPPILEKIGNIHENPELLRRKG